MVYVLNGRKMGLAKVYWGVWGGRFEKSDDWRTLGFILSYLIDNNMPSRGCHLAAVSRDSTGNRKVVTYLDRYANGWKIQHIYGL